MGLWYLVMCSKGTVNGIITDVTLKPQLKEKHAHLTGEVDF